VLLIRQHLLVLVKVSRTTDSWLGLLVVIGPGQQVGYISKYIYNILVGWAIKVAFSIEG
jgi:RNA polymerase subunit RPABC4/transcription elongation factor Spt4